MVAKTSDARSMGSMCYLLAKIHMVAKLLKSDIHKLLRYLLAKIHMVAKRYTYNKS